MASSSLFVIALVIALGHVECQSDRTRPRPIPVADGCQGKVMDLYFILDSSTSIYINDFRQEHRFVREVINRLDISQATTRVGMLTFSDDIQRPPLSLSRFRSKNEAISNVNIDNLPYRTGVTNTDLAVRYVRQDQDFRPDITKVIVVITDGGSRSPGSTAREAALAREDGFYLFVIGIGTYREAREWRSIASDPDDSFIFNITSFRSLDTVKSSFPPRACELPPIITRGSCQVGSTTDLYFLVGPSSIDEAYPYLDYFVDRTNDPDERLRVSYLMAACREAYSLLIRDFNNYCDRFSRRTEAGADAYLQLLFQLRERIRISKDETSRFAYQAAVLFVDEETMRTNSFQIVNEARSIEQTLNVRIVVVDLQARPFQDNLNLITSSVIRTNTGTPRQNQNNFLEATCRAITIGSVPGTDDN